MVCCTLCFKFDINMCTRKNTHEFPFNHCTTGQVSIAKSNFGKTVTNLDFVGEWLQSNAL
jgi:hypothetical protein